MKTDREKLIALIKEANLSMWGRSGISSAAERRAYLADYLISKGVTIPVRCSECREYNTNNCDDGFGWCEFTDSGEMDDHFCYYGRRRKE